VARPLAVYPTVAFHFLLALFIFLACPYPSSALLSDAERPPHNNFSVVAGCSPIPILRSFFFFSSFRLFDHPQCLSSGGSRMSVAPPLFPFFNFFGTCFAPFFPVVPYLVLETTSTIASALVFYFPP